MFVAKVLKLKSRDDLEVTGEDESDDTDLSKKKASLRWLIKRMCKQAKNESSGSPKLTLKVKKSVTT